MTRWLCPKIEAFDDDEVAEEVEQSSVYQGAEGEAGAEGRGADAVRGSDAQLGEEGFERRGDWLYGPDGRVLYRPREDVIPFPVYRGERMNAARTTGQTIERAFRLLLTQR